MCIRDRTNTFGANALKFHDESCSLKEIIFSAVSHVKEAAKQGVRDNREVYTALDIGPTGKLLKPMGDLEFETAYEAFKEVMIYGEQAGADLIHIETMKMCIRDRDEDASVGELARLRGGAQVTKNILDSAKEMKEMAKRV